MRASNGARMALCIVGCALVGPPSPAHAAISPGDRSSVRSAYEQDVVQAAQVPTGWTGSVDGCHPGTESPASAAATIASVNFFRQMNRLSPVSLAPSATNAKAQAASLMFEANSTLSHAPPASWACYSSGGAQAAGRSNIALGIAGAGSIGAYVEDAGDTNTPVGHRRWILYPRARTFGTGSTARANTLWVIDSTEGSRPSHNVVAWPSPGVVPWPLVYRRWSVSANLAPDADYRSATVAVSTMGHRLAVRTLPPANGYGDNTLVFEPSIPAELRRANGETPFDVTVSNVVVNGRTQTLRYRTIAIPADVSDAAESVTTSVSGSTVTTTWEPPATSAPLTGYRVSVRDALGRVVAQEQVAETARTATFDGVVSGRYRVDVQTLMSSRASAPTSRSLAIGAPAAGPIRGARILAPARRVRIVRLALGSSARVHTTVLRWDPRQRRWTVDRRMTKGLRRGVASIRVRRLASGRYLVVSRTHRTATLRASRAVVRFRVR